MAIGYNALPKLSVITLIVAIIGAMNFIETSFFTRHIVDLLDDADYATLQRVIPAILV